MPSIKDIMAVTLYERPISSARSVTEKLSNCWSVKTNVEDHALEVTNNSQYRYDASELSAKIGMGRITGLQRGNYEIRLSNTGMALDVCKVSRQRP